jgi:ABC-type uncharacterized transport system permease subunit
MRSFLSRFVNNLTILKLMRDNEILIGTFVLNFVITYLSRSFVHGRRDKDVYGQLNSSSILAN